MILKGNIVRYRQPWFVFRVPFESYNSTNGGQTKAPVVIFTLYVRIVWYKYAWLGSSMVAKPRSGLSARDGATVRGKEGKAHKARLFWEQM